METVFALNPYLVGTLILLALVFALIAARIYYALASGVISESQIQSADKDEARKATEVILQDVNDWEYTGAYTARSSNAAKKGHDAEVTLNETSYPVVLLTQDTIPYSKVQRAVGAAQEAKSRENYDTDEPYFFLFGELSDKAQDTLDHLDDRVAELYDPTDIKREIDKSSKDLEALLKPRLRRYLYRIGGGFANYLI